MDPDLPASKRNNEEFPDVWPRLEDLFAALDPVVDDAVFTGLIVEEAAEVTEDRQVQIHEQGWTLQARESHPPSTPA